MSVLPELERQLVRAAERPRPTGPPEVAGRRRLRGSGGYGRVCDRRSGRARVHRDRDAPRGSASTPDEFVPARGVCRPRRARHLRPGLCHHLRLPDRAARTRPDRAQATVPHPPAARRLSAAPPVPARGSATSGSAAGSGSGSARLPCAPTWQRGRRKTRPDRPRHDERPRLVRDQDHLVRPPLVQGPLVGQGGPAERSGSHRPEPATAAAARPRARPRRLAIQPSGRGCSTRRHDQHRSWVPHRSAHDLDHRAGLLLPSRSPDSASAI
jgi:hypothetical protein